MLRSRSRKFWKGRSRTFYLLLHNASYSKATAVGVGKGGGALTPLDFEIFSKKGLFS